MIVAGRRRTTVVKSSRTSRRGATLVIVAIMFTVLVGFVAMAFDFSRMYLFTAELQTLSDAAAMSAVIDQKNGLTESQAETNAFVLKSANRVEGSSIATMAASDITPVTWDFSTRTQGTAGSWSTANGVAVDVHYTAPWTFGRIFGSANRALNRTTVAAFGSLTTSSCLKPFAVPYAALLQKLGKPIDVTYNLTATDITNLDDGTTAIQFIDNNNPNGNLPGNFGWVDVDVTNVGNKNDQIANALNGCVSSGLGVGSTLGGTPGARSANVVQTALDNLCDGTTVGNGANAVTTCNTSLSPILVPIYDIGAGTGNNTTFHIKYVGAFKFTKMDKDGVWGYLTSLTTTPSGTLSSSPGPVGASLIVR